MSCDVRIGMMIVVDFVNYQTYYPFTYLDCAQRVKQVK